MSNTPKKALTVAVSAMTAMWSVGVAAFAPLAAAAAPSAAAVSTGDLIKASLPAVYYVGANGKRYVFPNEKTYKTWWSNFAAVQTITDSQLAAVAIGGNVTYRPGARLAKITTDPKVYMVAANAELHSINSEATALDLFGSDWAQKIDDVPDAFFTNYTVSSETIATGLGIGALPVGTLVWFANQYYLVGSTQNFMVAGDVSIYRSVVKPSSSSEFSAWMGEASGEVTDTIAAAEIVGAFTPDRRGDEENGGPGPNPTPSGVTVEVTQTATNLSMASASSQNGHMAMVKICAPSTITVDEIHVSSASGTVGFNSGVHAWFLADNEHLSEQTGTESGDTIGVFSPTDTDFAFSGCKFFRFFAATNSTSGVLDLRIVKVIYSGASATAATININALMVKSNAVAVSTNDLTDVVWSSPTASASLQTDGSKQKVFSVQASISNNDAYIPNIVFKINGSLMASNCELRIAGTTVSTTYKVVDGKYWVFEIPEASRVQLETSKTWELWCNVNGEAGQTFTPSLQYPAPYFLIFDNNRVAAAAFDDVYGVTKENVVPSISRILQASGAVTLQGASMTIEVVNLNNAKNSSGVQLTDKKTSGETNTTVAIYKVKVRGSKATLSGLALTMAGTNAAKGMQLCQVKLGQRNDKGEILTSSVMLIDFSLSNYGGENNLSSAGTVNLASTKQMQVGDWLMVVECDVVTTAAAYNNNDTMAVQVSTGSTNVSFDVGSSQNFPTTNTVATTITIKLLTALTVASNNTTRFLVANATDVIIAEYTVTGPTQEAVNITSVGITFAAGIAGTVGCTTVTLKNASGLELTTSQSLTSAQTLTFSVNIDVNANAEYKLRVVCSQASSNPTPATVTTATTLATLSGVGKASSQSFNNSPATAGATVTIAASGTITVSAGVVPQNQIIGNGEQQLIYKVTIAASIHEDMSIDTLIVNLRDDDDGDATNGAPGTASSATFSLNEINTVIWKIEGATVNGVASSAEQTICTRTVTGTGLVRTLTCNFADNTVIIGASQTALVTIYSVGNTLGNIGNGTTPVNDDVWTDITTTASALTSNIVMKGSESQTLVVSGAAEIDGRTLTPAGAQLRIVNKSIPSTTQPGQNDMVLAKRDVIVGGANVTLNEVGGQCTTSDAVNVCRAGTDTIDLVLDNTVIAAAGALAAGVVYDHTGLTSLLTVGTHDLQSRLDAPACSTSDTVQLSTNEFAFTVGGQSFASAGPGLFPVTVLADFNTFGSNNMTHPSNLCG